MVRYWGLHIVLVMLAFRHYIVIIVMIIRNRSRNIYITDTYVHIYILIMNISIWIWPSGKESKIRMHSVSFQTKACMFYWPRHVKSIGFSLSMSPIFHGSDSCSRIYIIYTCRRPVCGWHTNGQLNYILRKTGCIELCVRGFYVEYDFLRGVNVLNCIPHFR